MNHRLTIAAAIAVILASASEYVLIMGGGWLAASIGAVIVVAGAGTLTRLAPNYAAIGATALAAIACVPLLVDGSPLLKVAGLAVIACCAASASRLRAAKPVADGVTYLAALLLYLNLTLSGSRSWGLLIPTAKSLRHLMTLANEGGLLAKNSPPVNGTMGVILLAAASIGLAAIVVDIIAVRLNKPAIAGLPLLVLYMAPIATAAKPSGPGSVITFLLAAAGYLGLLASDGRNRLRGWGRIITVWHYTGEDDKLGGADIRGLAATGRRIGLAAVCAAIVAPLLLPTLNLHRLFGHGKGGQHVVATALPNPIDQLNALLTAAVPAPVLSYRSNNGNTGQYLQVYVLNYNPGEGEFTLVQPNRGIEVGQTELNQPPGLASTTPVIKTTTTIKLDDLAGSSPGYKFPVFFLPVPYWPTNLSAPGSWSESDGTLMIYSGEGDHSGITYTETNGQPVITPAEEQAAAAAPIPKSLDSYLLFPSSVTPRLTQIARRVTKGARTPFAKAILLENYFQSSRFTYTLQGVNLPNTPRGLLTFLTTDRRGFCEQFAFAMAALARLVGIPSRIAIGYTSGTDQHGRWQVTTADAHAWPELYFPGLGWLRFEPTPGGPAGQGSATLPSYATHATGPSGPTGSTNPGKTNKPGTVPGQAPGTHVRVPAPDPLPPPGTTPLPAARHPVPVGQILLGVLALLIVAAIVPGTARIVVRRRRWRSAADDTALARAAWQEVCADLDDFGLMRRLSESPRAMARRISVDTNIDESGRQAIGRIAIVVERCQYSPTPAPADRIRADVAEVRRSLAHGAGIMWRLRARLVPASVIGPATTKVSRAVGQRTGWVPSFGEGS